MANTSRCTEMYRGFEIRSGHECVYGKLDRPHSRVLTPVCGDADACRRIIDDFYRWERGMTHGTQD